MATRSCGRSPEGRHKSSTVHAVELAHLKTKARRDGRGFRRALDTRIVSPSPCRKGACVDDDDRPPLVPYVYEEIAKSLHDVDKAYWAELSELRASGPFAAFGPSMNLSPAPPKLPEHLRITLCSYARRLFLTEANEYPASTRIEFWLAKLAERVTERVRPA